GSTFSHSGPTWKQILELLLVLNHILVHLHQRGKQRRWSGVWRLLLTSFIQGGRAGESQSQTFKTTQSPAASSPRICLTRHRLPVQISGQLLRPQSALQRANITPVKDCVAGGGECSRAHRPILPNRHILPMRLYLTLNLHGATMLILLAFIIVFHITSAALLFISTIDNAWWVGKDFSTDVWKVCINITNCTVIDENNSEYQSVQAVQATMILSTILCCAAFLVFILQLFRLKQGERFVLTSTIQLLSCLCVMIAASIYTNRHEDLHKSSGYVFDISSGQYGYSFILAWIAFAFTLISGIMYLVLRKRK
ncbi:hypothetical protein KIL84_014509, partial [Mauremys mutica]